MAEDTSTKQLSATMVQQAEIAVNGDNVKPRKQSMGWDRWHLWKTRRIAWPPPTKILISEVIENVKSSSQFGHTISGVVLSVRDTKFSQASFLQYPVSTIPHERLHLHSISFSVEPTSLFVFLRIWGLSKRVWQLRAVVQESCTLRGSSDNEKLQESWGEGAGPTGWGQDEIMGAPPGPIQISPWLLLMLFSTRAGAEPYWQQIFLQRLWAPASFWTS